MSRSGRTGVSISINEHLCKKDVYLPQNFLNNFLEDLTKRSLRKIITATVGIFSLFFSSSFFLGGGGGGVIKKY